MSLSRQPSLQQSLSAVFDDSLSRQPSLRQSLMTVFQDSHHFGSLWWQSFKTAITSAVFDDSLSRQPPLRQSLMTVFRDSHHFSSLWRQPSLRQSLMTIFQDSHHFGSLWWQSLKTAITSAVFDDSLGWQRFSQKNPSRSLSGKSWYFTLNIMFFHNLLIFNLVFQKKSKNIYFPLCSFIFPLFSFLFLYFPLKIYGWSTVSDLTPWTVSMKHVFHLPKKLFIINVKTFARMFHAW